MTPPMDRPKQFHLQLSEDEHAKLKEQAAAYDMSLTDFIRWALGWHYRYKHSQVAKKSEEHLQSMGLLMKAELASWDLERVPAEARKDFDAPPLSPLAALASLGMKKTR
jgi:hypothetical protein